jgi:hypothetical protein
VRLAGHVGHDARDGEHLVFPRHRLALRRGVAEECGRESFGEDDTARIGERRLRVARAQREREHAEHFGIGEQEPLGRERLAARPEHRVGLRQPDRRFHLGHRRRERRREDALRVARRVHLALLDEVDVEADDPVGPLVEGIDAALVLHVERDQDHARHSQRQPADVEEREAPIPPQGAEGDFEIIF